VALPERAQLGLARLPNSDDQECLMLKRRRGRILHAASAAMMAMASASAASAQEPLGLELNAAEQVEGKCRLTFVTRNPAPSAVDSLKADTALFGVDGVIKRRLVIEFGPLKPRKTSLRAFDLDESCDSLGSLLINDVIACQPEGLGDCLSRLELSSRTSIKLFK
jgi:hypothetical protein